MLDKLNKNVCYFYTDSIVYIENEETKSIVDKYLGRFFGRMDR
jgi:hypothetical protein